MPRFAVAALFLVLAAWPAAQAQEPAEEPTVVAAFFSSGFCTACRILEPRLDDVLPDYADTALEYVKLSQTLSLVRGGAIRDQAEAHGVGEVYEKLAGKTGFVALVDPRDQQVIEIVTIAYDRDHIREAFDRALATAAMRDLG